MEIKHTGVKIFTTHKETTEIISIQNPNFITKISIEYISGKILDPGIGEGRDALYLAKKGFMVTRVDKSKIKIEKLREYCKKENIRLDLKRGLIEDFVYQDKYDTIYSLNVLHFLRRIKSRKVIHDMKRNTSEGGINVIEVFTTDDPGKNNLTYFKKGELRSFYKDWHTIHYKEYFTDLEKHGQEDWHYHHIAEIIAVKPKK